MAAHLFNESGQMQEVDIPDIFDVLEGGEDENTVKFLLGFAPEEATSSTDQQGYQTVVTQEQSLSNEIPKQVLLTKEGKPRKRDPVDPSRCIFDCDKCGKSFTTKFNLKRHINLHCSPSKEAGVPIQGPPSANMPSKKARERREALLALGISPNSRVIKSNGDKKKKSKKKEYQSEIVDSAGDGVCSSEAKPAIVTYQVQKQSQTITYHINNNGEEVGHIKEAIPLSMTTQHGGVPSSPEQTIGDTTLKMIQMIQPSQQGQVQPPPQQRVVHVVQGHNALSAKPLSKGIGQIRQPGNIPLVVQSSSTGVVPQAVSVSYVTSPVAGKPLLTTQTVQLPQISSQTQLKPVTLPSTIQIPVTSTMSQTLDGATPKYATILINGQQKTILTGQPISGVDLKHATTTFTDSGATITASIISSSYLPVSGTNGPPEDLFDSDEDDSSVATTTEAPSPLSLNDDQYDVKPSTVNFVVASSTDEVEESSVDDSDSLNLPSIPQRGQLQEIPKGWIRKIITTGNPPGQQRVFYYNTMGKKFSSQDEIDQYFARLGQTVRPGLFNFEPPKLVDEDEDEDMTEEEFATCSNNVSGIQAQQQFKTLLA